MAAGQLRPPKESDGFHREGPEKPLYRYFGCEGNNFWLFNDHHSVTTSMPPYRASKNVLATRKSEHHLDEGLTLDVFIPELAVPWQDTGNPGASTLSF